MSAQPNTLQLPVKVDRSTLDYWAEQLEVAASIRAGVMDSESKHLAAQRDIKMIIETIAADIRSKL